LTCEDFWSKIGGSTGLMGGLLMRWLAIAAAFVLGILGIGVARADDCAYALTFDVTQFTNNNVMD